MAYNQIAIETLEYNREDGSTKRLQVVLSQDGGTLSSDPLKVVGDILKKTGSPRDTADKPYRVTTLEMQIKDTGTIPEAIINATYREVKVEITDLDTAEEVFTGYVEPNSAEYNYIKNLQTVKFKATVSVKYAEDEAVANNNANQLISTFFRRIVDTSGIGSGVDFLTRLKPTQADVADVFNQLYMVPSDVMDSTEANNAEVLNKLSQKFNWQLVFHDGRWVAVDLYELFLNGGNTRRYVDNGAGSYSVTNEDHTITLDASKVLPYPTGLNEATIGRYVMQRNLNVRDEFTQQAVEDEILGIPDATSFVTSYEYTSAGYFTEGDKIDLLLRLTLNAEDTIAGSFVAGTVDAVKIEFTDFFDGSKLYFNRTGAEWQEAEVTNSLSFNLRAGESAGFDLGANLNLPENRLGTIKVTVYADPSFTTGSRADLESLVIDLIDFNATLLPDDEALTLYRQHIVTSTSGAGETRVLNYYLSSFDDYMPEKTFTYGVGQNDVQSFFDGANDVELGEMMAFRKGVLQLGKNKTVKVECRDLTGITPLSRITFDDGSDTYIGYPFAIKHELLSGFIEADVRIVPNDAFTETSEYTFTKIEASESKVGDSSSSRPSSKSFLTGSLFNSMVNKAMALSFDTLTTGSLTGFVTTVNVSKAMSFDDGDTFTLIDPNTLASYTFTVDGDQLLTNSITVQPKFVSGTIPSGAYLSTSSADVTAGLIATRFAVRMFARSNGVGVLTSGVSGTVSSLPVNLWSEVRQGENFNLQVLDQEEPLQITVGGAVGEVFGTGVVSLPIAPQANINAEKGTVLSLSGVQLHSYFHVDAGRAIINSEREKTAEAIGRLTADLSGTITSIPLDTIAENIDLTDGQVLYLVNKNGQTDAVTVNGNQTLTSPSDSLSVNSVALTNTYSDEFGWLREPTWKQTSRITVEAGRIDINVSDISDNADGISANSSSILTLESDVSTNESDISANASAILSVESRVTDAENDIDANASAVLSLDTRVTTTEGEIDTIEATAVLKVDANGRIASVALTANHDGSTIDIRADQINFDLNMDATDGSKDVIIGKGLNGEKKSAPQVLVGYATSSGVPFVHVRADGNNFVEMVGRSGGSEPYFQIVAGGNVVFKVDKDGETNYGGTNVTFGNVEIQGTLEMQAGGIIRNASSDWQVDDDGFNVAASSTYVKTKAYTMGGDNAGRLYGNSSVVNLESEADINIIAYNGGDMDLQTTGEITIGLGTSTIAFFGKAVGSSLQTLSGSSFGGSGVLKDLVVILDDLGLIDNQTSP